MSLISKTDQGLLFFVIYTKKRNISLCWLKELLALRRPRQIQENDMIKS